MPPKRGRGRGRGRGQPPGAERQVQPVSRGRGVSEVPSDVGVAPSAHTGQPSEVYRPPSARALAPPEHVMKKTGHRPKGAESIAERLPSTPSPSGEETLVKSMAVMSIEPKYSGSKRKMAVRPGFGKNGKQINLIANYFKLYMKDIKIFHYDVDIIFLRVRSKEGDVPKESKKKKDEAAAEQLRKGKSLMEQGRTAKKDAEKGVSHVEHQQKRAPGKQRCREVITSMISQQALRRYNPVYDGQKNIYTTAPLPVQKKETYIVTLDEDGKYKDFEVVIQPVVKQTGDNVISLEPLNEVLNGRSKELPQEILMAFDTVMCHRQPPFSQVQVGRSFFMLNQKPYNLGEGIEIWFGYSQSVRLTHRGPAVIVNFAAKAFHQAGSVIDYASDILRTDVTRLNMMNPRDIHTLSEALSKVRVQVTHLNYPRKYPVKAVTKLSARDLRFSDDGKDTTVANYFLQKHNRRLKYPQLPCLHMRSNNNTTYIPMEVCVVVPNQPKLGKLSGPMTADMIKTTAIRPAERFDKIRNELGQLQTVSGGTMNEFGLRLELRPMQLQGRIINPPALSYNENSRAQPDQCGKWRMDGYKFLRSREACSWMLFSFARVAMNKLEEFAGVLHKCARNVGMGLDRVLDIRILGQRDTVYQALKHAKDSRVTFVVIVLSQRDQVHSYEEVKFVADIKLRLITQCMKDKVVERFNHQVATNVLLKINSKLGGVNHALLQRLPIFGRPVIIFGADAAHSPRGFACPSIAALVGSLDAFPSRYAVTCRVQENPDEKKISQEIILDLKNMTKTILKCFVNNTRGKYPEKIIFFRDGVSEGQFNTVLETEITMIQEACNEALDGNIPPMTYIVVQKRHQTRFRPENPKEGVGRMGNVPPGTTVDTDVTHPCFFDFFICSHEGIQGTSKPAHYTVIFDENNFTPDALQELCYHLCHMYVRCNRSISIPPPVMYADLACTRAKKYADLHLNRDSQSSISSGSGGERKLPQEVEDAINNSMAGFEPGMFFV